MSLFFRSLLVALSCVVGIDAMAQNLTDPEIAHFLSTAEQSTAAADDLALKVSTNDAVRNFATRSLSDHAAMKTHTARSVGKLMTIGTDNAFSQSVAGAVAQRRQELSKLSGPAFDAAYVKNALSYDVMIIGALETTLIPAAQDGALKSTLQAVLAAFKEDLKNAQLLAKTLKQSTAPH